MASAGPLIFCSMPAASLRPLSVFVCYAREDEEFAKELSEQLGTAGFRCLIDKEFLHAGVHWQQRIKEAITSTEVQVICLSTRSLAKEGYVQRELRLVEKRLEAMAVDSQFVIPIRLDDCTPPDWLAGFHREDFFSSSAEEHRTGFVRLARALAQRAVNLNKLSLDFQVPALFRFSESQIKEQLRLIFRNPCFERNTPYRKILDYLVKHAIAEPDITQPDGLISTEELAKAIERTLGRFDIDRTRTLIKELNVRLTEFYADQDSDRGELFFRVPRLRRPNGSKKYHCEVNGIETWHPRPHTNPSHLHLFWEGLVNRMRENRKEGGPPVEVLIIYSNEQPELKERQDNRGRYSGSGEVIAAHLLGRTLTSLGIEHQIARSMSLNREHGGSFTTQPNSIRIYLGSSLANKNLSALRDRPEWQLQQHCRFQWYDEANFCGEILYAPPSKEPKPYRYDSHPTEPTHEVDYALISVLYDEVTNATIVGLGGLSTLGTEQAARFVCEDVYLSDIFNRLRTMESSHAEISGVSTLEMIREVRIVSGQPTGGEIVHIINHRQPSSQPASPTRIHANRSGTISSKTPLSARKPAQGKPPRE